MDVRPRILAIQFRMSPTAQATEQAAFVREAGIYTDIDFVSITDQTLPWQEPASLLANYAGLLLGGSGDFDFDGGRPVADPARVASYQFLEQLSPLFQYVFEKDIPTFGICYGHQLLGAFAGAVVRHDERQKKMRSHEVRFVVEARDSFLFADIPDVLYAQYGHKDSLDRVPSGAVLWLQGGEECQVSALRYRSNIFTTQFHPELTGPELVSRLRSSPGYLPQGAIADELVKDDPNANRILQNFSRLVAHSGQRA